MKIFRHIAPFIVLAFTFSSCSKQLLQVYNVESSDTSTESNMLVYEDDTIKVLYNFWDENGRMLFAVQNKLDKAITIDWKKSNFSLNGKHLPYWRNEDRVRTSGSSHTWGLAYGMNIWGFTTYASSSIVSRDVEKTHLPPGAWMERFDFKLQNNPDKDLELEIRSLSENEIPKKERNRLYKDIIDRAVEEYSRDSVDFPKGQSPVYFRNYLTIDFDDDEKKQTKAIDNSFEVRSILTSPIKKDGLYMALKEKESAKRFYSLRKDRRPKEKNRVKIDYAKSNLTIAYSGNLTTGGMSGEFYNMASIELGYAHLFKKRYEIGIVYTASYNLLWARHLLPNPNWVWGGGSPGEEWTCYI